MYLVLRKFIGSQIRVKAHCVKKEDRYKISEEKSMHHTLPHNNEESSDDTEPESQDSPAVPREPVDIPDDAVSPKLRRSSRTRHRPKYLNSYVTH